MTYDEAKIRFDLALDSVEWGKPTTEMNVLAGQYLLAAMEYDDDNNNKLLNAIADVACYLIEGHTP